MGSTIHYRIGYRLGHAAGEKAMARIFLEMDLEFDRITGVEQTAPGIWGRKWQEHFSHDTKADILALLETQARFFLERLVGRTRLGVQVLFTLIFMNDT